MSKDKRIKKLKKQVRWLTSRIEEEQRKRAENAIAVWDKYDQVFHVAESRKAQIKRLCRAFREHLHRNYTIKEDRGYIIWLFEDCLRAVKGKEEKWDD